MAARLPMLSEVTLAVLAGGEGSRMGKPKGMLQVRGRPILEYLMDRFAWPGPTLLVTAPGREKPPGCERFEREVTDVVAGEGPLLGVVTAMEACETELLFVTTVDMPEINAEHASWMLERLHAEGGVMGRRGGRVEPFPSMLRVGNVEAVRRRFEAGERSVASLADGVCVAVDTPWGELVWTNLNSGEEFERWGREPGPPGHR